MHGECPTLPSAPPSPPQTDIHFIPDVKADVRLQTACSSWACWAELHSGAAGPQSAAGQLGSPGILVLVSWMAGLPALILGLRACVPWMPGCQSLKALRRPAPVLSTYQEPEAQRWTWSSDHTPFAQLGFVPLWGPPMADVCFTFPDAVPSQAGLGEGRGLGGRS